MIYKLRKIANLSELEHETISQ